MVTTDSPHAGKARAAKGFTLVELLLVIGMIGVLASLTMPTIGGVADIQLMGEAEAVSAHVYNARRVALALKRCVLVQAGNGTPASYLDGATLITRIRAREELNADCETTATVNNTNSWSNTPVLPDLIPSKTTAYYITHGAPTSPIVWRPGGFSRGNGDADLSDGVFNIRVVDTRSGHFVMVRYTQFGQACTGKLNQALPPVGCN